MFKRLVIILALAASACSQQAPPPPPPAPSVGRYQITAVAEGDRSTTLILLDTTTGESWYFHQPVGQLFNGFWGNVPKAVTPDSTWSQAFQHLLQNTGTNRPPR